MVNFKTCRLRDSFCDKVIKISQKSIINIMGSQKKNVCVVVLGDIGRSPRMQYHSLSLAEMGHTVDVIGYGETEPMDEVKKAPLLYYHYLLACPTIPFRLFNYIFKTLWQSLNLLFMFLLIRKPDTIIVQNPPAIPTLFICWFFSLLIRAKLIIDWHNYAHTIMALSVGKDNVLVKITKFIETFVGRRAGCNFCVTNAMKNDLKKKWNIDAITLYDKPPTIFRSITLEEKHQFFKTIGKTYNNFVINDEETIFTKITPQGVTLKSDRPGLLVSSTSWTEDEDFSILFSALQDYETHHKEGNTRKLPNLICIITGKGHLKDYYAKKISKQNWKNVLVLMPWLESADYPKVLASADLGVCLHTSSSGLDLPMKVVDMFGCGLPVCAFDFNCLNELVQHGKTGYIFRNSKELSQQLQSWFEDFPNNSRQQQIVDSFKGNIRSFQTVRWRENWNTVAAKHF